SKHTIIVVLESECTLFNSLYDVASFFIFDCYTTK
ncbi:unnamed protein product, partial [Brassica oleracea var. botrytis]